jgi:hypothetical protein
MSQEDTYIPLHEDAYPNGYWGPTTNGFTAATNDGNVVRGSASSSGVQGQPGIPQFVQCVAGCDFCYENLCYLEMEHDGRPHECKECLDMSKRMQAARMAGLPASQLLHEFEISITTLLGAATTVERLNDIFQALASVYHPAQGGAPIEFVALQRICSDCEENLNMIQKRSSRIVQEFLEDQNEIRMMPAGTEFACAAQ